MIDYRSEDADQGHNSPDEHALESLRSPLTSPRGGLSVDGGDAPVDNTVWSVGWGGSVITAKVVFAPHQLIHDRSCVDQVRRCSGLGERGPASLDQVVFAPHWVLHSEPCVDKVLVIGTEYY